MFQQHTLRHILSCYVVFIICGIFCLQSSVQAQTLQSGLIGYWSFDQSNAQDSSNFAQHGSVNRPVEYVDGKKGKAVRFRPSSQQAPGIIVSDSPILNRTDTAATICFWAKYETSSPRISQQSMLAKWYADPINGEYLFTLNYTPVGWRVQYTTTNSDSGFKFGVHYSSCPIDSNDWFFVAMTFRMGEMQCYFNGVLDTVLYTPFLQMTQKKYLFDNLQMGGLQHSPAPINFSGMLDEVRIYDRVLSATEIGQLYGYSGAVTPGILVVPTRNVNFGILTNPVLPVFRNITLRNPAATPLTVMLSSRRGKVTSPTVVTIPARDSVLVPVALNSTEPMLLLDTIVAAFRGSCNMEYLTVAVSADIRSMVEQSDRQCLESGCNMLAISLPLNVFNKGLFEMSDVRNIASKTVNAATAPKVEFTLQNPFEDGYVVTRSYDSITFMTTEQAHIIPGFTVKIDTILTGNSERNGYYCDTIIFKNPSGRRQQFRYSIATTDSVIVRSGYPNAQITVNGNSTAALELCYAMVPMTVAKATLTIEDGCGRKQNHNVVKSLIPISVAEEGEEEAPLFLVQQDRLHVYSDAHVKIYTSIGKEIYSASAIGTTTITLPKGYLFIVVSDGIKTERKAVVVE